VIFGGKARSVTGPGSGSGRGELPGEHGFRFFSSFYKRLRDTMARISYGADPHSLLDNLVPASRSMIARVGAAGRRARLALSSEDRGLDDAPDGGPQPRPAA
jgi:hypothetical protein